MGPAPLVAGDRLQIGDLATDPIVADLAPVAQIVEVARTGRIGQGGDDMTPEAMDMLARDPRFVDRMGKPEFKIERSAGAAKKG